MPSRYAARGPSLCLLQASPKPFVCLQAAAYVLSSIITAFHPELAHPGPPPNPPPPPPPPPTSPQAITALPWQQGLLLSCLGLHQRLRKESRMSKQFVSALSSYLHPRTSISFVTFELSSMFLACSINFGTPQVERTAALPPLRPFGPCPTSAHWSSSSPWPDPAQDATNSDVKDGFSALHFSCWAAFSVHSASTSLKLTFDFSKSWNVQRPGGMPQGEYGASC